MARIADRYGSILFDLDGVLFRGSEPIPHAASTIAALQERGPGIAFVTNNSARTPAMVAQHLAEVGVDVRSEQVETSALTTAEVLSSRDVRSVFLIGEAGLREALADVGISATQVEGSEVDYVVVGFDRSVDYEQIRIASVLVQRGVPLLASNADASYPSEDGLNWPGSGAILAAITTTTGAEPEVIGKPNPPVFEAALRRAGGGRPLVVGDRLDTDIEGAARLGWDSLLVLTGVSERAEIARSPVRPTFVAHDLRFLLSDEDDADEPGPAPGP